MSACDSLLELLAEWHRCTLAEAEAIRAHDWPKVRACHSAKTQLQTLLGTPAGGLQAHFNTIRFPAGGPDRVVREMVEQLIALEAANRDLVASQKASLQARRLELDQSSRNLQRLRKSYVLPRAAHWQSYS